MDSVFNTLAWYCLSNGRRKVLVDDTPRHVRKSLLKCQTHMANATTDVNEERSFRLQAMAEFLLERINIQKDILSLPVGHHPLEEIVEARRHSQSPIERHLVGSVSHLEWTVCSIGRVLVLSFGKKIG